MKKLFQKINDNKQLRNGIILLTFLLIVAIMAPVLATYDPFKLNDDILAHPGGKYLLGTDGLGRDVFSGILYGAMNLNPCWRYCRSNFSGYWYHYRWACRLFGRES